MAVSSEVPQVANHCIDLGVISYIYRCDSSGGATYEIYNGVDCQGNATSITTYQNYDVALDCAEYESIPFGVEANSFVDCGTASFKYSDANMYDGVYVIMSAVFMGIFYAF